MTKACMHNNLLCSDGISTVGKYTDGRRDDVRIPFSVLNSAKFFSLWLGRFFKNSLIDWWKKLKKIKNHLKRLPIASGNETTVSLLLFRGYLPNMYESCIEMPMLNVNEYIVVSSVYITISACWSHFQCQLIDERYHQMKIHLLQFYILFQLLLLSSSLSLSLSPPIPLRIFIYFVIEFYSPFCVCTWEVCVCVCGSFFNPTE